MLRNTKYKKIAKLLTYLTHYHWFTFNVYQIKESKSVRVLLRHINCLNVAPLINCILDHRALVQATHQTEHILLQFWYSRCCICSQILYVDNRVQMWTVGSHRSGEMKAGVSQCRRLIVSQFRCARVLSCWKIKNSPEIASDR